MQMHSHKPSAVERAITAFANTLSALSIIFILPVLARHIRPSAYDYLLGEFPSELAVFGSWLVIILLAITAFFGISTFLQLGVQKLFQRGGMRGQF